MTPTNLLDGRVNQKQRTRRAIIAAAAELLQAGKTPTIAEVADHAAVSRATAYRYFPSQDLLLAEAALDIAVPNISQILAQPELEDDPAARLDAVVHAVQQFVVKHDSAFRTLIRLSMEPNEEKDAPQRRGGRRIAWLTAALEPLRSTIDEQRFQRLVMALGLCTGIETQIVLRDIYGLDQEEAVDVARWTAQALLHATLSRS